MTENQLSEAVAIHSAIEKLKSLVENKGEPMGLSLGMGTPITISHESPLYEYFIDGIKEELDRLQSAFESL